MINALVSLFKMLKESLEGRKKLETQNAKEYFDTIVTSSFNQLEKIHNDYIKSISALVKHLKEKSMPPVELIDWLRERGLEFRSERDALWTIQDELRNISFNKVSKFKEGGHIQGVLKQYFSSIIKYSETMSDFTELSFYRNYEHHLTAHLKRVEKSVENENLRRLFYRYDFVEDMHERLIALCDYDLSKAWSHVCSQYRIARSLMV